MTSSTGQPYTLYTTIPPVSPIPPIPPGPSVSIDIANPADTGRSPSPTPITTDTTLHISTPPPKRREHDVQGQGIDEKDHGAKEQYERDLHRYEVGRAMRVKELAAELETMYCPCAGFLFNALGGERNFLVGLFLHVAD